MTTDRPTARRLPCWSDLTLAIAVVGLSACAHLESGEILGARAPLAAPAAPPKPKPEPAATAFATFVDDASATAQGGALAGFAYAEKAGDAKWTAVKVTGAHALVSGVVGAGKGSAWAGVGVVVPGSPNSDAIDLSRHRVLRISLASATAKTLRVRLLGPDPAVLTSGCYPVLVQAVSAEIRSYDLPLSAFAPESYCGTSGRTILATLPAVTSVEIADAATDASKRRDVSFQVGPIQFLR